SFKYGDRWARRNNPNFENNLTALVAAYREARLPVIYFLHSDTDEAFSTDSPYYKLMDFLDPLANEPLLHKTSRNCFTTTDLQRRLTRLDVRRLVITGIQTEQCCETTARVGADLGYDVDFVTDATLTFPIQREPGDWADALPAEAVVERTEFALRRRFARIATAREILEQVA
ncbi:MAG TPA: isochorismatase family protein, partial [Candidatus Baltobacteraceae bacterium]|nr:isochorismatase family protein [Candidatus Baltobacteraceae bacterium]